LGRPGLVIIDVRGSAAYEFGGHIPGAVHTTWHEYSDPNAVPKGLLNPDLGRIEKTLRQLGISQESDVVIYSNPFDNWGDEGRMFWMLEYLGHQKLRILDGGWVKWTEEKRPFEHGPVTAVAGTFTAQPVKGLTIAREPLKDIVRGPHPQTAILDARSLEEYVGKEVPGIPRPGHIPSAIHVAWNVFLNKDATGSGADLLLYRRGSFVLAVFHSQAGRVSEGQKLSGILVGVESRLRLSGRKRFARASEDPRVRSCREAFLTAYRALCKVTSR
jgi:thiosulfate/3-mercaptopyruvate sulfurtransferase